MSREMIQNAMKRWTRLAVGCCLVLLATACGDDEVGTGTLTVLLESEDTVTEGLEAGSDGEDIQDGWSVDFDKYIAAVGDVDVALSTDTSVSAEAEDVFVVDLTTIPAAGLALWSFDSLAAGRWDFNYSTPGPAGAMRDTSVAQEDYDAMVSNGWTYFVDAVMTNAGGQSCPPAALATPGTNTPNGNVSGTDPCYDAPSVRLTFGAAADTTFGPCEIDEVPGFNITAGGNRTVAATIHGDHLFFNGFPEGDESGVTRLAQWWADCDLNLDGTVTQAELSAIAPAQLPSFDPTVFQTGGSPITPLDNMYTYVRAQLKTQGHYQGEGECPVDGVAHHDD